MKQGDRLWEISQKYGVNKEKIVSLNGLSENSRLVLGKALDIPGSTYVVETGESLWIGSVRKMRIYNVKEFPLLIAQLLRKLK